MMDVTEIRKYLPHRYPFLLVDRVVELNLGESIVAYQEPEHQRSLFRWAFPRSCPCFPGCCWSKRWPRRRAYWALGRRNKTPADGSIYYFVGADKLRFKRPCIPGDRVMLRLENTG